MSPFSPAPNLPGPDAPFRTSLLDGLLFALTVARWLVPTEATADGETLWIAGLWLLAGAIVPWLGGSRRRFDLADLSLVLLVGGHVLSGIVVLCGEGDRRAAVNLGWEWLSLGVLWFAWRAALPIPAIRQAIVPVLMTTAITLSLWGLWQYFVWYPQMQRTYGPLLEQQRQWEAEGKDATVVRKQLRDAGIPTDGPSRELFLNRLMQSREPFGPFALANTFGGLLAAWLVVGVGVLLVPSPLEGERVRVRGFEAGERQPPHPNPLPRGGGEGTGNVRSAAARGFGKCVAFMLPVVICLYLTNSRTAWVGAIAAALTGIAAVGSQRIASLRSRLLLFPLLTLAAGIVGVATLFVITRDFHAVPGPMKSLAYRGEYWIGTWKLLASSPWLGAGLGQFRDRYLEFRLPVSSEEIADPHILLLDVWANGGVMGLVGLLGLLVILWRRLWQFSILSPPSATAGQHSRRLRIIPGLAGFLVTILYILDATGWDEQVDRLVVFAAVWFAVAWLLPKPWTENCGDISGVCSLAALVLSLHLLGAGGIAMPAVTQLWLLLIAAAITSAEDMTNDPLGTHPLWAKVLTTGGCVILCIACWWMALRPVTIARRLLANGDFQLSSRGNHESAAQSYQTAADFDPLVAEPWRRLADLEFARATASGTRLDRSRLDAALAAAEESIRRAPFRPAGLIYLAEMQAEAARRSRLKSDWQAAVAAFRRALPRHPTHVGMLAGYALALAEAGQLEEASLAARRALAQDEINRARGHTERYLPDVMVRQLQSLSDSAISS